MPRSLFAVKRAVLIGVIEYASRSLIYTAWHVLIAKPQYVSVSARMIELTVLEKELAITVMGLLALRLAGTSLWYLVKAQGQMRNNQHARCTVL